MCHISIISYAGCGCRRLLRVTCLHGNPDACDDSRRQTIATYRHRGRCLPCAWHAGAREERALRARQERELRRIDEACGAVVDAACRQRLRRAAERRQHAAYQEAGAAVGRALRGAEYCDDWAVEHTKACWLARFGGRADPRQHFARIAMLEGPAADQGTQVRSCWVKLPPPPGRQETQGVQQPAVVSEPVASLEGRPHDGADGAGDAPESSRAAQQRAALAIRLLATRSDHDRIRFDEDAVQGRAEPDATPLGGSRKGLEETDGIHSHHLGEGSGQTHTSDVKGKAVIGGSGHWQTRDITIRASTTAAPAATVTADTTEPRGQYPIVSTLQNRRDEPCPSFDEENGKPMGTTKSHAEWARRRGHKRNRSASQAEVGKLALEQQTGEGAGDDGDSVASRVHRRKRSKSTPPDLPSPIGDD